jgi:hypothetical protein
VRKHQALVWEPQANIRVAIAPEVEVQATTLETFVCPKLLLDCELQRGEASREKTSIALVLD